MSSIVVGTAALVAISTLGSSMKIAVEEQARMLLGADLALRGNQSFGPETEALIDSLGGLQSRQISFTSMVFVPESGGTRIASVRALEGPYPFYGSFLTEPETAGVSFRNGQKALVDAGLMTQFGVEVGDEIRVGGVPFQIAGRLRKIPGENAAMSMIGPRVYIPVAHLNPDLIDRGSRVSYTVFFKFPEIVDVDQLVAELRPRIRRLGLRSDTVLGQQQRLGRILDNLYRFLNLGGFVALLLGGIGVASAIHAYMKRKMNTVAVLKCLGASSSQTFSIYLIQASAMGLVGSVMGVLLGTGVMNALPALLGDFLPVDIEMGLSPMPILQGLLIGLSMAILFALLPLLSTRTVSPLITLRSSFEGSATLPGEPLRWAVYATIGGSILLFSVTQTQNWIIGLAFCLGLTLSFAMLLGIAHLIIKTVKKYHPASWSYVWRQGLANLYRPNNQTVTLMVSLGLGASLLTTLYLTQHSLMGLIDIGDQKDSPNMVLFDIQTDQKAPIEELIASHGMAIIQQVPLVTMRLGDTYGGSQLVEPNDQRRDGRRRRREFRASYRPSLTPTEKIIAGKWRGIRATVTDTIFVSLDTRLAANLDLAVGDPVVFDVQGFPMETTVGSIRTTEARGIGGDFSGFFSVLFPVGVLEPAPQFHVVLVRTPSAEQAAALQQEVVKQFANVSVIDLDLILTTADAIFEKVALVVRFMALFSIITGLVVLIGVITNSRYQRVQESILLKTLGAVKQQVLKIMLLEYFFLGFFAVITGMLISLGTSWALAFFLFDIAYDIPLLPILGVFAVIVGVTVLVGMLCSLGIHRSPPLEVLRNET